MFAATNPIYRATSASDLVRVRARFDRANLGGDIFFYHHHLRRNLMGLAHPRIINPNFQICLGWWFRQRVGFPCRYGFMEWVPSSSDTKKWDLHSSLIILFFEAPALDVEVYGKTHVNISRFPCCVSSYLQL